MGISTCSSYCSPFMETVSRTLATPTADPITTGIVVCDCPLAESGTGGRSNFVCLADPKVINPTGVPGSSSNSTDNVALPAVAVLLNNVTFVEKLSPGAANRG